MTAIFNRLLEVIKLSAAVHELSY